MNRFEKRAAVLPDYGIIPVCNIPNICQALHKDNTKIDDPLRPLVRSEYVRFLKVCLETWEHHKSSSAYDDAMHELIEATLHETRVAALSELLNMEKT